MVKRPVATVKFTVIVVVVDDEVILGADGATITSKTGHYQAHFYVAHTARTIHPSDRFINELLEFIPFSLAYTNNVVFNYFGVWRTYTVSLAHG